MKIPGEIGQFLGWYVIAKLMPSQELARACGTVPDQRGVAHCRGRKCLPVGTGPIIPHRRESVDDVQRVAECPI